MKSDYLFSVMEFILLVTKLTFYLAQVELSKQKKTVT